MRQLDKKVSIKITAVVIITIVAFMIFSIPLGIIPPLGSLLFPGNGLWKVPGEVPVQETVFYENLTASVTVIRDEWGVPHIFASNEADMSFALGYCQAQDRLFQMDLFRRRARGMLSEVIGDSVLEMDKLNLALGMEYWGNKTVQKALQMQEEGEIEFLDDLSKYIDGINYYIASHKNEKPLEYYILDFEPTEWSLLDIFSILKYMHYFYTWQYSDLYRYINFDAFNAVNESWYSELFGPYMPYQIPVCPNYGEFPDPPAGIWTKNDPNPSLSGTISNFLSSIEKIDSQKKLIESQNFRGSNNWVVNGSKTTTGKPILCNDMHWGWAMPNFLYESHLVATEKGMNVYGYTVPGMPITIVGHNNYVGWGMTICPYDVLDWYYYNAVDEDHYIYNGTTTAYTTRNYAINVKGQDPVEFAVKETVHGPVLTDFIDIGFIPELPYESNVILASKWLANSITYEFIGIYELNHAHNWDEFNNALSYFAGPASNFVYADIYGNIAVRPIGLVPIRDDSKIPTGYLGNGSLPYNGSNGEGEWIGFIPFDELPNTINPAQKYLTSSNQIAAGPNYKKYFLQNDYAEGYRARRINELLSKSLDSSINIEKMMEFLIDVNSTPAQAFTPYLIGAIETKYGLSPPEKISNVLTVLKDWTYVMDKDSAAPTIYRKWRDYFNDYTFDDEWDKYNASRSQKLVVLEYLMREKPDSHWFDNVSTTEVEIRDDIILIALDDTIKWLEDFYDSSDLSDWRWGDIHKHYFRHLTGLPALSIGPFDGDGERFTLTPSGANIREGVGLSLGGAAHRLIIDFSDLNNSRSVIAGGQRGLSNSRHYQDQLQLFLEGKYHYTYFANDASNFPTSSIESRIYFTAGGA